MKSLREKLEARGVELAEEHQRGIDGLDGVLGMSPGLIAYHKFIAGYAANLELLQEAVEVLEFYGNCAIPAWEPPANNLGDKARAFIKELEEFLGKDEE
jgi:hypothetical protein